MTAVIALAGAEFDPRPAGPFSVQPRYHLRRLGIVQAGDPVPPFTGLLHAVGADRLDPPVPPIVEAVAGCLPIPPGISRVRHTGARAA
jgi:hypothetical protein